jgi:methionyl-tRNA formyltransferase
VVFLGRNEAAGRALTILVEAGARVDFVVGPTGSEGREYSPRGLLETAGELGLRTGSFDDFLAAVDGGLAYDLLVSFLFWTKIPTAALERAATAAVNLHPAPLPGFRGARGYNAALLEGVDTFGASLHHMTGTFDAGDLIDAVQVPVRPTDTALSLYRRTMLAALGMFEAFVEEYAAGHPVRRVPQEGPARSATRREMLARARILPGDDAERIARKARAFWFPPFPGAVVELAGEDFTVVDEVTLRQVGHLLHAGLLEGDDAPWP